MSVYQQIVDEIKQAKKIVITSHKSPDGDSIGSSMGLYQFIKKLEGNVTVCHPDPAPRFLVWLDDVDQIINFEENPLEVQAQLTEADLIFCLDYNAPDRVGSEMQPFLEAAKGRKVMIDHHLFPQDFCQIVVSDTASCSTSQLICELIVQTGNAFTALIGTPLYLGIMTDSGSFRFPSVQPRTHELIAELIKSGVQHYRVHEQVYDTNTLDRLRLQGYALSEKLEILDALKFAIISLTEKELNDHHYQKGDTEGLVNIALSIQGMKGAVFLAEKDGMIKMSFRSKGQDNPVNKLASEHFSGGGHANAAGGRSDLSMEETLLKLKTLLPNYF